jgi:hypothetical protein
MRETKFLIFPFNSSDGISFCFNTTYAIGYSVFCSSEYTPITAESATDE